MLVNSYSEQLAKSWAKTVDYLIQQDDFYQQITTVLFDKAKKLDILSINKFDFDVWQKIGSYHEQYGQLRQALHDYEFAYRLEPENDYLLEKIKELKDRLGIKQDN